MLRRSATAAILLPLVLACGASSSPPAAPTPATLRASVGITSIAVRGDARPVGQAYSVTVHLHESAGTAATIVAVDLTFMSGTTVVLSSHSDQPISDSAAANVCPANGSVDTREFVVVDADPSHPYAASVQAKITFSDSSSAIGTATATTTVPALPSPPPPPPTFTLSGVITDAGSHAAIAGARVEVLNGSNAGKTAITDGGGTYILGNLAADTFRLRVSANDYDAGEQGVTVPFNPRADFELRRTLPNYAGVWTGSYGISDCQDIDPPGLNHAGICGLFAHVPLGVQVPLLFQFTLSQSGSAVTGTYKLVTAMFSCPCGGDYGTFDMAGTIAPDGTLVLSGSGGSRFSGVLTDITFNLRITGSALTGTVAGSHSFGGYRRATFTGTILSGTR
jgi:carboxypeptidase family protein